MLRELLPGPGLPEEGKDPGIPEGPEETDRNVSRGGSLMRDMPDKEAEMKLKNVLIVVNDIERSRKYYHDLFGLEMILDNDGNMILTEGLVLQDAAVWKGFLKKDILPRNNASELYFEEKDIEGFVRKLEDLYPDTVFVNRLMTHSWGQKVIRFYDPDGNLIEVGTPM
jgi:catechol 2,3-dioxygenase-like lactoylglutathione lyase family enzyme